jgi:hypothetical protein
MNYYTCQCCTIHNNVPNGSCKFNQHLDEQWALLPQASPQDVALHQLSVFETKLWRTLSLAISMSNSTSSWIGCMENTRAEAPTVPLTSNLMQK